MSPDGRCEEQEEIMHTKSKKYWEQTAMITIGLWVFKRKINRINIHNNDST